MTTPEQERLLDHEYDGIREFDNPTPGWWHLIFFVTVIFSVGYYVFWQHSPLAYSVQEAWEIRQTREFQKIFGAVGELKGDEETIQKMRSDERMLAIAKGMFQANCAACHAKDGGGINGVNLTDNFYKNVKVIPDIFTTITKGANNGAMPSWEQRLSTNQRVLLAAYVANLRGTSPASPKAPEGNEIPSFPAPPPPPAKTAK